MEKGFQVDSSGSSSTTLDANDIVHMFRDVRGFFKSQEFQGRSVATWSECKKVGLKPEFLD